MNWRQGMFRLWIVASFLWILPIAWLAYHDISARAHVPSSPQACFEEHKANPALGNPFDCFDDENSHLGGPIEPVIAIYAALATGPALATLLLWLIGVWVAAGFNRPPKIRDGG
jgi:hypothetical protein